MATRTANSPYTPVSRYQLREPLIGIPPYYECHLIAEDGLFPTGASIVRPERHVHFQHLQTDSCARCWRFPPSGTSSPQFRSPNLIKYPRFRLLIIHSEEFSAHSAGQHPFIHRVRACLQLFPYLVLKELCRLPGIQNAGTYTRPHSPPGYRRTVSGLAGGAFRFESIRLDEPERLGFRHNAIGFSRLQI